MPQYIYKHPEKEEYVEVFQHMNDEHVYFDEDGIQWKRVFTVPQMAVATKIDPFDQGAFVRAGEGKNETIGELWDKSSELSRQRAELNGGVDPIKEKALEKYSKDRKGAIHPSALPKTFKNDQVTVEF